jgi:membrane protein implicated in regulation of membrane protease activity
MSRAPFSGRARNVELPTRQRVSVCPWKGIFSIGSEQTLTEDSRKGFREALPARAGNAAKISKGLALVGTTQSCELRRVSKIPGVMTIIFLLFVLGIVLLVLDLFVPGIILSVAGAFAFLAATAQAFSEHGVAGGLEAFAAGAALLAIMLYIEYGLLPKTRFGQRFFLHASVHGVSQPKSDVEALKGRECVALTPLVPTGQVEIDGRRYEARSLDGQADRGARLRVTGTQNFSLTVTKIQ